MLRINARRSFIYNVHSKRTGGEGVGGVAKFWTSWQVVVDVFWREEYFSDSVHVNIYKQRIFFFYHISSFPITVWLLLHCFHPQTSFVVCR